MRALLAGVVACAVVATGAQQPAPTDLSFTRSVAPFEVLDGTGQPYALPLLGGLDVPRPQFVDIDADGDLDLFVQEYSDAIMFFENTGSAAAPDYVWRSDKYQDLDISEWYRFVDIDGDGLVDVLGEHPFSRIRHYRNVGTPAEARFELVGQIVDSAGDPMFFDRQNIPALVDLDCDGRLDFFIGRIEGTVTHYEADSPGSARFAFLTELWEGIQIIGQIGENGTMRHGANALAFADFEGDGDLDLFWGDFFEPGVLVIENIGRTCSTPSFQVDPVPLPYTDSRTSGYNAPSPVDLDFDGDLDFLMGVIGGAFNPVATSENNLYYWERIDEYALELRTTRFLHGIDIGSETNPAVADIDADGDLDIVVGNKNDAATADGARLYVYENVGSTYEPRFRQTDVLKPVDAYYFAPEFGDLDADGDLDLLLGTWNENVLYFRNDGSPEAPTWVQDEAAGIDPPRVSNAVPALGDIDRDGDLDLFIGQANGRLVFYRNVGTPRAARWEFVSDSFDEIRVGRRSAPTLVDVDGDGLLDLVVGRESRDAVVFRNVGSPGEPHFEQYGGLELGLPPISSPVFADIDGDGLPDVVSGSVSGGLVTLLGRRERTPTRKSP
jgi:hypothetical protein